MYASSVFGQPCLEHLVDVKGQAPILASAFHVAGSERPAKGWMEATPTGGGSQNSVGNPSRSSCQHAAAKATVLSLPPVGVRGLTVSQRALIRFVRPRFSLSFKQAGQQAGQQAGAQLKQPWPGRKQRRSWRRSKEQQSQGETLTLLLLLNGGDRGTSITHPVQCSPTEQRSNLIQV